MKIGIVLISDNFAGAERVVREIISKSDKKKFILFINNEIYNHFQDLGVEICNMGEFFNRSIAGRILLSREMSKKIDKIVLIKKIDILNLVLEYSFLIGISMKNKSAIVSSLHGAEVYSLLNKKKFLQNIIIKEIFKRSKVMISVSKGLEKKLSNKYKKKTIVILNGVDSSVFRPMKNIDRKKGSILFTGRYIERKGCLDVIEAARKLPQFNFLFAGKGPLSKKINLPNTKDLGYKNTLELVTLYNSVELVVFPAHWEALPLCGLEAMACGRVVIATPKGFSEYIDDGKDGLIIPSKNSGALKKTIKSIMADPKKRKRIEVCARKKAIKNDWNTISKRYMKVFEECI